MKYYITPRNNQNNKPTTSIFDTYDDFFRPFLDFEPAVQSMKTDIKEVGDNYMLDVEMPGFDKKDIDLKFEEGYLTVSAKTEDKAEDKYVRRERKSYVSRSYYVGDIKQDALKATYNNGILSVTFPKELAKTTASRIAID
jgi:HSP20 family molecular chaperone IbpA